MQIEKKKQTLHENALLQNYFLIVTTFSRQVEFSEDTSFYKKCDNWDHLILYSMSTGGHRSITLRCWSAEITISGLVYSRNSTWREKYREKKESS